MPRTADATRQLSLGLPEEQPSEDALRRAFHKHCASGLTFDEAMARPAIKICLTNLALAAERRRRRHSKEPA